MSEQTYRKSYGAWAGFPAGKPPDFTRCCVQVWPNERGARHHQCGRKRGFGPDGAYCKQHDPEAVAERQAVQAAKYHAKNAVWEQRARAQKALDACKAALTLIRDGHNDPRYLAAKTLALFSSPPPVDVGGEE